jgi:DNA (cytosine-5)-methyltransferase 1
MNELHLFAGAGGGILGGMLLGHTCVCAVEIEPYPRSVLLQRQRDGILPWFPIWDDVCTFDGRPWRGLVDVVCGGFPCQDISAAGKGAGITGERSGLWSEMARIIGEVRPRYAFVENSPMLTVRGLGVVLGDLAAMGYDARWGVLGAVDAGAPHKRERIWIVADADEVRCNEQGQPWSLSRQQSSSGELGLGSTARPRGEGWWSVEPALGRVADGVAHRVDRLAAIGNGQVPAVAALAWRVLAGAP